MSFSFENTSERYKVIQQEIASSIAYFGNRISPEEIPIISEQCLAVVINLNLPTLNHLKRVIFMVVFSHVIDDLYDQGLDLSWDFDAITELVDIAIKARQQSITDTLSFTMAVIKWFQVFTEGLQENDKELMNHILKDLSSKGHWYISIAKMVIVGIITNIGKYTDSLIPENQFKLIKSLKSYRIVTANELAGTLEDILYELYLAIVRAETSSFMSEVSEPVSLYYSTGNALPKDLVMSTGSSLQAMFGTISNDKYNPECSLADTYIDGFGSLIWLSNADEEGAVYGLQFAQQRQTASSATMEEFVRFTVAHWISLRRLYVYQLKNKPQDIATLTYIESRIGLAYFIVNFFSRGIKLLMQGEDIDIVKEKVGKHDFLNLAVRIISLENVKTPSSIEVAEFWWNNLKFIIQEAEQLVPDRIESLQQQLALYAKGGS